MLRDVTSNELFTVLIVIGLVFIALARLLDSKRFNDFVLVIRNSKYLKIYAREQKFLDVFDGLLFVNFIISLSIFSLILYQLLIGDVEISVGMFFKLIFAIGVFILIKVLFERLIGSLFEIDTLIDQYLFQKISYKNFIGIILLPVNALLIYSLNISALIIFTILFLLLVITVIGLITSIKGHQNLIKNNLFYFILYLCALEIAPYLILYKVIL